PISVLVATRRFRETKVADSTSNNQLAGSKHDDFDQILPQSKNGCAYANPTNNCARKMSSIAVRLFAMSPQASNSSDTNQSSASTEKTLSKRSENQTSWAPAPMNTTSLLATLNSSVTSNSSSTTSGSKSIPPSEISESNICGDYDGEEQMGVCLWSGPSSDSQYGNESGWVSSDIKRNCHKEVILQLARVLEGCNFNTADLSIGCSQIYVTKKVFMALNPNPSELEQGALQDPITWDFVIVEDFPCDLEVGILARRSFIGHLPRAFNTLLKPCGKDARSRPGESSRYVIFGDKL
ncbi:hypothetical protein PSHT_14048, partial [Puccinia striiformis]